MSSLYFTEQKPAHRGFTLIELLVVIVIIGILASLIFVGAGAARNAARRGIIKNEISQVSMALTSYQQKYGEYPPDFSDYQAVLRHVRKRWPNFDWQRSYPDELQRFQGFCDMIATQTAGIDPDIMPYQFELATDSHGDAKSLGSHIGALAFWLGGIPDTNGMLNGFSADVTNPLGVTLAGSNWSRNNITQWDKDSQFMELTLKSNCFIVDGVPAIVANGYPIAYFKPNAAGKYIQRDGEVFCIHLDFSKSEWEYLGVAVPYAKKGAADPADAVWHNPKTYQLIHPGLDGIFGVGHSAIRVIDPANDMKTGCELADNDNQANFGGNTIESAGN